MNSSFNHHHPARPLSEVSAGELDVIEGGRNSVLYDFDAKVGVTFQDWGIEWTNANGSKGYHIYSSYK